MIELSLVNYKMLRFSNSNLAASALYLAQKMTKQPSAWSALLEKHSHFKEVQIRPCAKELFMVLKEAQHHSLQAVRKKFALSKYCEVAKVRLETENSHHHAAPGKSSKDNGPERIAFESFVQKTEIET